MYNKSDSPKEVTIELPIKIRYGLHSWKGYGEGSEWKQMSTKRKTKTISVNLSPKETYENTYQIRSPSSSKSVKSVSYTGDIKVEIKDFI